jgi:dihydroceramidase
MSSLNEYLGGNSQEVRPSTLAESGKGARSSFLAFGSKPFQCPAKPKFGPRLVGLLIGILLKEFPDDYKLMSSKGEMEFGPGLLSNDRSGWEDVYLLVPNH